MDEHAGVHIAVGVDVEVAPSAGDAAAHKLAVVLEVHGENGLACRGMSRIWWYMYSRCSGVGSSSGAASLPTGM